MLLFAFAEDAILPRVSAESRVAGRAILLTPQGRMLLVKMYLPWLGDIWMVPGGGQEPGESIEETAVREIHEETGLASPTLGPKLYWRTLHIDTGSEQVDLFEHYFLVRTEEFEASAPGLTDEERDWWRGHGWWSAAEIRASQERFAPPEIGDLLAELVEAGPQPLRRIGTQKQKGVGFDSR